jgi:hypothetical protein
LNPWLQALGILALGVVVIGGFWATVVLIKLPFNDNWRRLSRPRLLLALSLGVLHWLTYPNSPPVTNVWARVPISAESLAIVVVVLVWINAVGVVMDYWLLGGLLHWSLPFQLLAVVILTSSVLSLLPIDPAAEWSLYLSASVGAGTAWIAYRTVLSRSE